MLKLKNLLDYLEVNEHLTERNQKLQEEILLPFKMLAWKKLSEQNLISEEYNFFEFIKNNKRKDDFIEIVNFFSKSDYSKKWRIFLESDLIYLEKYDEQKLIKYINSANILENYPNYDEFFYTLNKYLIDIEFISEEIIELIALLLEMNTFSNVYNPYPNNYELALKINNKLNVEVFTEDNAVTSLPFIINILFNTDLKIAFSDSIVDPSYKEGYSLTMFDAVVSAPPVKRKIDIDLKSDIYNRFNFKEISRVSPSAVYILQIIAQAKNKAIIIVPASFLNRSLSADVEFRKYLLDRTILDTVILLPEEVSNRAVINLAILIFDRQKVENNVLFINASKLANNNRRSEKKHIELQKIIETIKNRNTEAEFSFTANYEKIQEYEYSLNPKTYMEFTNLTKIFKGIALVKLSEVAEVILSPLVKRRAGNMEVFEIQPTDIDEFGLIKKSISKKNIDLTETEIKKTAIRNFDILLISKGIKETVGKVGLVVNKPENEVWIPGQSMIIIRPKSESDAKSLFMFFTTDEAKEVINSLATGSFLLSIPARALREMKIPQLNSHKLVKFEKLFEEFLKNYSLIEKTKDNMKKAKKEILKTLREE